MYSLPFIKRMLLIFMGAFLAFTACKKDKSEPVATKESLLKDSVYLYTREVYLWQDALPSTFQPSRYDSAEDVLEAFKQYKKGTDGKPIDRYSFIDREGVISGEIQDGVSGDFGFDIRYQSDNDLRVKLVYPGSPAGQKGMKRGWKILKVNGNANIGVAEMEKTNYNFLISALNGSSISLTLQKPDNTQAEVVLNKAVYTINPVLYTHVYERNGKKIGYMVFNSFVSIYNGKVPTIAKSKIDEAFASFESAGVNEVIIDMRYNGGGSVETSAYFANRLIPSGNNGQVMFSYRLNSTLSADPEFKSAFASVPVSKEGGLNPARVYFIVTGSTASASELLINNMKPYTDVKVIGERYTYGKPVGFFPIPIMDVELYAVSFETLNKNGQGEYYSGIPSDNITGEDLTKDFGDENESCLAQALYYSRYGIFSSSISSKTASTSSGSSASTSSTVANKTLDARGNKNMFIFRKVRVK